MARLMILVLVVILSGIIAIAALFAPGYDPANFWGSIVWLIVLVFINWLPHVIIAGGNSARGDGAPGNLLGSLPGISVIAFPYTLASISFLVFYLVELIGVRLHLTIQIALLVLAAVFVLTALFAAKGAAYGSESPVTQNQLVNGLGRLQRMTDDPLLLSRIQDQINYVSYRLPHPSKLNGKVLIQALQVIEVADMSDLEGALAEFKRLLKQA